jgi:hypothetical protein
MIASEVIDHALILVVFIWVLVLQNSKNGSVDSIIGQIFDDIALYKGD